MHITILNIYKLNIKEANLIKQTPRVIKGDVGPDTIIMGTSISTVIFR